MPAKKPKGDQAENLLEGLRVFLSEEESGKTFVPARQVAFETGLRWALTHPDLLPDSMKAALRGSPTAAKAARALGLPPVDRPVRALLLEPVGERAEPEPHMPGRSRQELRDLAKQESVRALLQGHNHQEERDLLGDAVVVSGVLSVGNPVTIPIDDAFEEPEPMLAASLEALARAWAVHLQGTLQDRGPADPEALAEDFAAALFRRVGETLEGERFLEALADILRGYTLPGETEPADPRPPSGARPRRPRRGR